MIEGYELTDRGRAVLYAKRWELRWKRVKCLFGKHWDLGLVLTDARDGRKFTLCASCGKENPDAG